MRAEQRRQAILALLQAADQPISATALSDQFSVSRQIIVGDVALLRASGAAISATPRGYMADRRTAGVIRKVAVQHSGDQMETELTAMVDQGCTVLDVTVEHPVYGELCAPLQIFSRAEADEFVQKLKDTQPLCCLTDGVHLHRLQCPTPSHEARVLKALEEKGFLQK